MYDVLQDMDMDRFAMLRQVIRNYGDSVYTIPSKMKTVSMFENWCRVNYSNKQGDNADNFFKTC